MRKWAILAIVAVFSLLLLPQTASAGRVYFNAAAAEGVETGVSGTSCGTTVRSSSTGWDHTYVTRDCDKTSDEAFVWHFYWQSDMPGSGTVTVDLEHGSGSAGNAVIDVDIGCIVAGTDLTYGSADSNTVSVVGTFANEAFGTVGVPATAATDAYCAVRVRRDADNGSDALDADVFIRGGWIEY